MIDEHAISQVRKQLGDHNDDSQPVEWCVQNMRLCLEDRLSENERLASSLRECMERANQQLDLSRNVANRIECKRDGIKEMIVNARDNGFPLHVEVLQDVLDLWDEL